MVYLDIVKYFSKNKKMTRQCICSRKTVLFETVKELFENRVSSCPSPFMSGLDVLGINYPLLQAIKKKKSQ